MTTANVKVSDLLVTAKSREIQRGMFAEWRGDKVEAARHLLAAGHLELVLAEDYDAAGNSRNALRSRISAASCFWRSGDFEKARFLFDEMLANDSTQSTMIAETIAELEVAYPSSTRT